MPQFLLHHSHAAAECAASLAAWRGFRSPLRRRRAPAGCLHGSHEIWWRVEAEDATAALAQLPPYVAARTRAQRVREIEIP